MKFKLEIDCGNSAFDGESMPFEVARILREAAERIAAGRDTGTLQDDNGNTVGSYSFKK